MKTILCLICIYFSVFNTFASATDLTKILENKLLTIAQTDARMNESGTFFLGNFIYDSSSKVFNVDISGGSQENSWNGICVSLENPTCERTILLDKVLNEFLARSNGYANVPAGVLDGVPSFPVKIETSLSVHEKFLFLTVKSTMAMSPTPQLSYYKVKFSNEFKNININFLSITENSPKRRNIQAVDENYSRLSSAVALITKPSAAGFNNSEMGGNSISHGTGFFISNNGLMMTNHHVIAEVPNCLEKRKCLIELRQTNNRGEVSKYTVNAKILTYNKQHDFCIFQIEAPDTLNYSFLEVESKEIGPELLTLGFPGDRTFSQEVDSETTTEQELTFSFGGLIGVSGRIFSTSLYITGGASGSPVLNRNTLKLIGLNSNGSGLHSDLDGMAALVRPIHRINNIFGVTDYISGKKQTKVRQLIERLQSPSVTDADLLLKEYLKEKTYIQVNDLINLMVEHQEIEVRKLILHTLIKMGIAL